MTDQSEAPQVERYLPCTRCSESTPVRVLNHLGARCQLCFEAYCREPQPPAKVRALPPRVEGMTRLADVPLPPAIPLPVPRRRDAEAEYAALPPVELP